MFVICILQSTIRVWNINVNRFLCIGKWVCLQNHFEVEKPKPLWFIEAVNMEPLYTRLVRSVCVFFFFQTHRKYRIIIPCSLRAAVKPWSGIDNYFFHLTLVFSVRLWRSRSVSHKQVLDINREMYFWINDDRVMSYKQRQSLMRYSNCIDILYFKVWIFYRCSGMERANFVVWLGHAEPTTIRRFESDPKLFCTKFRQVYIRWISNEFHNGWWGVYGKFW